MKRYDVHALFARAHLRTRAERAVYFTLVAQLAKSWSALELARLKGLDLPTVQAILERYAVAGIVEVSDASDGSRYQWRSDMTYLFRGSPSAAEFIDPVCGMTVDESTPYRVTDAFGRRWLFCARVCLTNFQHARPSTSADRTDRSARGSDSAPHHQE
jgi:YHS domain-containing protein